MISATQTLQRLIRPALAGPLCCLIALLAACDSDHDSAPKSATLADIPWEKVRLEARPLTKPGQRVADKLEKHKAALGAATFPVLVPGDATILERLEVVVKPHLYTAMSGFRTHRVEVFGVRSGKPDAADELVLKDKCAEITFVRWGVSYRVRVVCESVLEPDLSLCADGKLVGAVRANLVWMNPR